MLPSELPAVPPHDTEAAPSTQWRMAEHWPELVVAVTEQSIESVSLLLRGLDMLVSKGKISPAEYKVLALPADRLKNCGMSAQQIVRFQSGRVRQSHEKIDLAYLLECVLQERRNELALMGITVRRKFKPVDVLIDPTLGFSLTKAMLDWSTPFGNRIDLRLELQNTPSRARLWMKTYGDRAPTASAVFEDGINWLLLRQIAATDGGIEVERNAVEDGAELTVWFKRTLTQLPPETSAHAGPESMQHSVTGAHVVVLSPDTELRLEVVGTLKKLGVMVDGAAQVAQVRDALKNHAMQLMVLDTAHTTAEVTALVHELREQHAHLPIVEILPANAPPPAEGNKNLIARNAVGTALGSSVMFALARVM
ncbi:MAG: hypothetical protein RI959_1193 [Pseudomonadota bacterium]|jgi:hypothetical protein